VPYIRPALLPQLHHAHNAGFHEFLPRQSEENLNLAHIFPGIAVRPEGD
jgi:hypothetical protein